MTDNVHRGPWGDRDGESGSGEGDPPESGLLTRVAALEADMKTTTASLGRIETTLAVVAEGMKAVATKAELVAVTGAVNVLSSNVAGLEGRVVKIETAITDTVKTALAKSISPVQAVSMLAGAIAVLIAAGGLVNWLMMHGYFPHSP